MGFFSRKEKGPSMNLDDGPPAGDNESRLGCCHNIIRLLVKLVHIVDAIVGTIFIVYGSLMQAEFEEPATEAVIWSLVYGTVLLFTCLMGVFGLAFDSCSRCGLLVSAWTAPFIALLYIVIIITLLVDSDGLFDYLEEHKDVMYLNQKEIDQLEKLLPLFYASFSVLAAIEISRFFVVRSLRSRLLRLDEPESATTTGNSTLTEALLEESYGDKSTRAHVPVPEWMKG